MTFRGVIIGAMSTPTEITLREKLRRVLLEEVPGASDESIEKALARILTVVDPFERAAQSVLERYDRTFTDLAK